MDTIQNTLFIGKFFLQFDELDSTNEKAMELLSISKPAEGTVISAYNQRAGRGQFGSKWESTPGENLTISIILRPTFLPVRFQFLLSQAVALGVRDWVEKEISLPATIKWPNDIYIGNRKTGGILIQNTVSGSHIQASVVGIGINVKQTIFHSDAPNPTSFSLASGKSFVLENLLPSLCQQLEHWYLILKQGKNELIQETYLQHLFRFGIDSLYQDLEGNVLSGKITGINQDGYLEMTTQHGLQLFGLKDIKFIV